MTLDRDTGEPDWDTPLSLTLTPGLLIHTLMSTASAVHTGWSSCIDDNLVLTNQVAMDDQAGHYVRLIEQEFVEDDQPDMVWHDWTLEIRIGSVLITGHWQFPATSHPSEWEWNAREAERAFERACVLIGRRVRRGIQVEEPILDDTPRARRH
jgi:lysozyme family protein